MTGDAGKGHDLLDALGARGGIVCMVGAGGKKTAMMRLAALHDGHVGLTATTRVPFRLKRDAVDLVSLADDLGPAEAAGLLAGSRIAGYAGPRTRHFRLAGMNPVAIAAIHAAAAFDVTYVKADGARMRLAKAHKTGEPTLVPGAATILLLASVHAVGRAIDEATVHHPELFAALAGAKVGDAITADRLAAVLGHQVRTIGAAAGMPVIPVINMADDDGLLATAREIATQVWQDMPGLERLAITSMIQPEPLKHLMTR